MRFMNKTNTLAAAVIGVCASAASAVPVTDGMLYRLDAGTGITLNGGGVSAWADQSGNGRDFVQANVAKQPLAGVGSIGGLPAIRFDGVDDELVFASPTTPVTVFIVNTVNAHTFLNGVWGSEGNDAGIRVNSATAYRGGNAAGTDGNDFTANPNMDTHHINGVATAAYTVGTPHIIGASRGANFAVGKHTFNSTSIGEYFAGRAFNGDVAEVIAYDRALTAQEVHRVEGSLGLKYNIAVRPGFVIAGPIGGDLTDPENDGDDTQPYNPGANQFAGFDAVFTSNVQPGFSGESAFNAFDNQSGPSGGSNKWCCTGPANAPGGALQLDAQLLDGAFVLTHFTLTSSNDSPERDPLVFSILGSNDGENFETIFSYDGVFGNLFTARNQTLLFEAGVDYELTNDAYEIFRYQVTGTGNNAVHAIAEIEYFGVRAIVPEPMTASLGLLALAALSLRSGRRSRLA